MSAAKNALVTFVSKQAIEQYNAKDYANATKNFELTYKLSPTDTTQLYNAAVSASLAKDYESSLKNYMKFTNSKIKS